MHFKGRDASSRRPPNAFYSIFFQYVIGRPPRPWTRKKRAIFLLSLSMTDVKYNSQSGLRPKRIAKPMSSSPFDLVIIGAGPGGYICAIRASQFGLKTALVEKDDHLGGTCLNVGCIPSKALLHSTEQYTFLKYQGRQHGIFAEKLGIELETLMKQKDKVVHKLRKGIQELITKHKIHLVKGTGKLLGQGKVEVNKGQKTEILEAGRIVLATGSCPVALPILPFDDRCVISSNQAIALTKVPRQLVVVGGGAIGLELGSVWQRLGSEVTILEALPHIAAGFDQDIAKLAERLFKKQNLRIETATTVQGLDQEKGRTCVIAEKHGKAVKFPADIILVAVGRKPCYDDLGLEALGVKTDDKQRIVVDEHFQTNVAGIYAIGDIIAGPMLAHKAEEEGLAVANTIAGRHGEVHYDLLPNVIYTEPEIASVGLSESQSASRGLETRVGKFPLSANGRAIAQDTAHGLVKVIAEAKTDRLLGVHLISSKASELIAAAAAHMTYGGSAEDLSLTIHAHPTLAESLKEAAMAVGGGGIHAI